MEVMLKTEWYAIIGACFEACSNIRCGFLDPDYQERLEIGLQLRGIPSLPGGGSGHV
jgi:hypothetical protein